MTALTYLQSLNDIIRGSEPAPTPQPRQFSCNACLDSGELSEGGPCWYCGINHHDDDAADDDLTVEQMCLNMGVK
jgi:hypothetical protein